MKFPKKKALLLQELSKKDIISHITNLKIKLLTGTLENNVTPNRSFLQNQLFSNRNFLKEKRCSVKKKAGRVRKEVVTNGALAAWDFVEVRCRKLQEIFYVALCRNTSCTIGDYRMTKPNMIK